MSLLGSKCQTYRALQHMAIHALDRVGVSVQYGIWQLFLRFLKHKRKVMYCLLPKICYLTDKSKRYCVLTTDKKGFRQTSDQPLPDIKLIQQDIENSWT